MFEEWYLHTLISKTIRDIWKLTDYYLLGLIDGILDQIGIKPLLEKGVTLRDIINKKDFPDNVYSSLEWILDRMVLDDYIAKNDDIYKLTDKKVDYNLEEIRQQAVERAPDSIAAFNMLQLMADNYPDYLAGKKSGIDIIFSPDTIDITNEYYSNNLFYNVHNIAGAKICNWDIENRTNPRILEIGGGLGGGTKQFLQQRLREDKPISGFTYHFSDIANKMLRVTRKALSKIHDDLSAFQFIKFDFNKTIEEQDFKPGSLDVIWGVNAAHVAVDLRKTLELFHSLLKPGGALIISETVRPVGNQMIQQEFILNTIGDYWNVKLDKDIRPCHGFMEWTDWVRAFETVGFSEVATIPDMSKLQEQYDNCYVAVVRGVK